MWGREETAEGRRDGGDLGGAEVDVPINVVLDNDDGLEGGVEEPR